MAESAADQPDELDSWLDMMSDLPELVDAPEITAAERAAAAAAPMPDPLPTGPCYAFSNPSTTHVDPYVALWRDPQWHNH